MQRNTGSELDSEVGSESVSTNESNRDLLNRSETASERAYYEQMMTLTPAQIQRLRDEGLEHMIPAEGISQLDRQVAIAEIFDVLEDLPEQDLLHLNAREMMLLRRIPGGPEQIRLATSAASEEITRNQVAEARAFLRAALDAAAMPGPAEAGLTHSDQLSNISRNSSNLYGSNGLSNLNDFNTGYNHGPNMNLIEATFPNSNEGSQDSRRS
jgi:hypothetical protein